MLSQVSVEHDNNHWVNCVKSQDCRRTLAGEARTKAGNDPTIFTKITEFYQILVKLQNYWPLRFLRKIK